MRRLVAVLLVPMVLLALLPGRRAASVAGRAQPPSAFLHGAMVGRSRGGCSWTGGAMRRRPPRLPPAPTRVLAAGFKTFDYSDVRPDEAHSLFLLDGTAMLYRCYYSKVELEDYHPEYERPLVLLGRDIASLIRFHRPTHLAVAFDFVGPRGENVRRAILPTYKANREESPEVFKALVPQAMRMFEALGCTVFQAPGYESDDIAAALVRWLELAHHHNHDHHDHDRDRRPVRCTVVSDDKDLLQLVRDEAPQVQVLNPRLRQVLGVAEVTKKVGVPPHQLCCLQALAGDQSDNVPGVAGVGPKTAAGLLKAFGDLDGIYANLDRVAALPIRGAKTLGAKLAKQRELAFACREVVRLRHEVPLPGLAGLALEDLRYRGVPDDAEERVREITGGVGVGPVYSIRDSVPF